ncbi:MAG: hypothetical protein ACYTER_10845 [Planctomycetota bacterium]|jgi:phage host-nuclease inhibitor protein Gam
MSEEDTAVNSDQLAVSSEEESGCDENDVVAELKADHAEEVKLLREEIEGLRDSVKEVLSSASEESGGPVKTAGVRPGRSGVRSVLASAAVAARESGKRVDVQEYMRVRRLHV